MMPDLKSEKFLTVLQAHKGIIYKVAHAYCKDAEDRNDLVQEIMIQLWKSFENYNEQFRYSTWIYQIALNVAISFYRKESRRQHIANPICEGILNYADNTATEETEESISILHRFIAELKELDKALMLLYLEEKSYKEIAGIIGISETNVATKIGRIKFILKQKFLNVKQ
ncbi:RNA polymerase sigma factor [Emticicia sp. BO119]|uniref:RNA polymerase sigma factor n=1 Tax=Emticicia sp. BO119 TaxID=2757768 RepID=UPI0015F024C6|nr:RNA polymerase sigma factor [Emticicia sp. BO119]MBA4852013.1 RNA polymerase sigma factor [Emticicia sp. BO119]